MKASWNGPPLRPRLINLETLLQCPRHGPIGYAKGIKGIFVSSQGVNAALYSPGGVRGGLD